MKSTTRARVSRRSLKLCIGTTTVILITATVAIVILCFTILKPKDPETKLHLTGLESINLSSLTTANIALNVALSINNKKNYGSFEFEKTTAYVNYHGDVVAEVPIGQRTVPARGQISIDASASLMIDKMVSKPEFLDDFIAGSLNLSATASFRGKVSLLKVLAIPAEAFSTCEISFFVASQDVQSKCKSKVKLWT